MADLVRPEPLWPVDSEYQPLYDEMVARGNDIASRASVAIVGIARSAMPVLPNTLALIDEVAQRFKERRAFVFENDSKDDTAAVLDVWQDHQGYVAVKHETLGALDNRAEFEGPRTERLAYCRNQCFEWVKANAATSQYTIVVDVDPPGGFSVDGVMNSVAWLNSLGDRVGAMASFSLYKKGGEAAQYDAFAARGHGVWRCRRNEVGFGWFSMFLPPVGSPPIRMNSAFGGLAVYRTEAFLSGGYSGEDCEHVPHHRRMADAGWSLYLNPGCRYISVWQ